MLANLPKKARRTVAKRTMVSSSKHPLLPEVRALVNPFDSTPGVAKHLVDPLPSQSYKLKSRATITVGNSNTLVGLISPCFGGHNTLDPNYPSAIFVSTSSGIRAETIAVDNTELGTSPVKGTTPVYSLLTPNRPYTHDVTGSSWRLISYGIRIRYTGTALNANGTVKMLPNDLSTLKIVDGTTWGNVIDYVDGSSHTIMRSVYDRAVYSFNGLGATDWMHDREIYPCVHDEGALTSFYSGDSTNHWCPFLIGQNSSTTYFGQPGMLITYTNNTTSSVQFEIELVENWEARTPGNAPFHTDSHGNPELSAEVFRTVVSGHMHAAASNSSDVVKSFKAINSASKSPLGKAVIAAALA